MNNDTESKKKSTLVLAQLWIHSFLFGIILFLLLSFYAYIQSAEYKLLEFSQAIATTAGIMISSSLGLSSFCYYFNVLDSKIKYRKYLGLIGFWLALLYSILLPVLDPDRYWYGLSTNFFTADILLGITAVGILAFMAVISNKKMMQAMGVELWRKALRLGYVAIFLLVVRAGILESDSWMAWITSLDTLPPLRLLLSIYAVLVILMRISLEFSKKNKRKISHPQAQNHGHLVVDDVMKL